MAVRSKEEIMETLRTRAGENTDDDFIALLEDVSDTFDDYESRTKDSENWKQKYEDNDKAWRDKYTERFFSNEPDIKDEPEEKTTPKTFDDLFTREV